MAITVPLITTFDSKGIRLAEKRFADFQKQTRQVGQSIRSAFIPAAAAVAGLGAAAFGAARAAMEDQQSQAQLARQLQATTKATNAQVQAVEQYVASLSLATGVADDELRPALARIVRSTRDVAKAQKVLGIAVDVARGSGKSLQQVSEALSRAYGGNVKALARLDPSLREFITKTTTADEAVARLADNFRGAAARHTDTFQGRMDKLRVAVAEATESFGYALLPILERFVNFLITNVLPYVDKLVRALEQDGLSGAVKMAARDFGTFLAEADGWKGTVIDLTGAMIALTAAVKGLAIISSVAGAAKALSGVLSVLGTKVIPGLAATAGVVAGIFASIFATFLALSDLMRDETARPAFLETILNMAKLIANAFIVAHNAVAALVNAPVNLANLLPGVNVRGPMQSIDLLDLTFDQTSQGQRRRQMSTDSAQIQIQINGAIDPVATGRQVRDVLDRTNRRGM